MLGMLHLEFSKSSLEMQFQSLGYASFEFLSLVAHRVL